MELQFDPSTAVLTSPGPIQPEKSLRNRLGPELYGPEPDIHEGAFDPAHADFAPIDAKSFDPSRAEFTPQSSSSPVVGQSKIGISDEAKKPFKSEDSGSIFGDIGRRAVGTGLDIAEFVGALPTILGKYAVGLTEGLKGAGSEEAGKAMAEYSQGATLREQYPNLKKFESNPAIEVSMEAVGKGIKTITDNFWGNDVTPGRMLTEDAINILLLGALWKASKGKPVVDEKGKLIPKPDEAKLAEAQKIVDDINKNAPINPEAGVDTSGIAAPQYGLKPGTIKRVNKSNDIQAAKGPDALAQDEAAGVKELTNEINPKEYYKPYWPDKELERAKILANSWAEVQEQKVTSKPEIINTSEARPTAMVYEDASRIKDLENNAKFGSEMTKATTMKEALDVVNKYVKDPDLKLLAERLQNLVRTHDSDVKFRVVDPEDAMAAGPEFKSFMDAALGGHFTDPDGSQTIYLRGAGYMFDNKLPSGLSAEVALHEMSHGVTEAALRIANDPVQRKKPQYANQVAYAKELSNLKDQVYDAVAAKPPEKLPGRWDNAMENANEFNAYSWTDPEWRAFLKGIELPNYGKSAWQVFVDSVKKLFGYDTTSTNALTAVDSLMDRLDYIQNIDKTDLGLTVSDRGTREYKDINKVIAETPKEQDIGPWKKLVPMTMNQKAVFLNHPFIKFMFDKTREIVNDADVRFNLYKTYLRDVESLIKNKRKDALEMFKILSDIQDPKLKDLRALAENNNTREQFLKEQGMRDELIPLAIKVLNITKVIGIVDQANAGKFFGHSWERQPMYYPREHVGPWTVTISENSPTGEKIHYMKGFEDSPSAHYMHEGLQKLISHREDAANFNVVIERNAANSIADVYAALSLNANPPEFLKGITDQMLKEMEVRKRKFELERSTVNIAGYTGEKIGESHAMDSKVLSLLQKRMEQSFALETKGRILREIKTPLLDSTAMQEMPMAKALMEQFVYRELGVNLSKFRDMGKAIDKTVENFGKEIDRFAGSIMGYKGGDVSYFKPRELARIGQYYTGLMSMWKLASVPSVLASNATSIIAVGLDGFRTAGLEGVNNKIPALASIKAMSSHLDPNYKSFMKQADLEGMVEPRISDPLRITEEHGIRDVLDNTINLPRNYIEKATNLSALTYYYNYYKLSRPELKQTSTEFKQLVYEATRSWTGDYSKQATLLAVSQTGDVGHLFSNFAKWKFNQLGRLGVDFDTMVKTGAIQPLVVTFAINTLLAGAVGAPILVEYDALRQLLQKMNVDIPPLAGAMYKAKDWIQKEFGGTAGTVADAAIKGPMTWGMDKAATAAGMTSGPDVSASLRYSSVLSANTLPFSFAYDMMQLGDWAGKGLMKSWFGLGYGPTRQDVKEGIKGLPSFMGSAVKSYLLDQAKTNAKGETEYVSQASSQDKGFYTRKPDEHAMAYTGIRSKKENEEVDRNLYLQYWERKTKKDVSQKLDQMMANLTPKEAKQLEEGSLDIRKANPKVAELAKVLIETRGTDELKYAIKDMQATLMGRNKDFYAQEFEKAQHTQDVIAKVNLLKQLEGFRQQQESRNTSSGR
jgi:hypothetical protein